MLQGKQVSNQEPVWYWAIVLLCFVLIGSWSQGGCAGQTGTNCENESGTDAPRNQHTVIIGQYRW